MGVRSVLDNIALSSLLSLLLPTSILVSSHFSTSKRLQAIWNPHTGTAQATHTQKDLASQS